MFPKLPPAPKMSRSKALNEMCKSCIYDKKADGTWREQVENCETSSCPLWQHRPMTTATINIVRADKAGKPEIDVDAILAGLDDDEDADVDTEVEDVA
jgi:hypothetical protein